MVSLNPKIATKLHRVDSSGSDSCSRGPGVLYVSDSGNNRIQKWGILDLSFWRFATPSRGAQTMCRFVRIIQCAEVASRGALCCDSGRGQWQRLSFGAQMLVLLSSQPQQGHSNRMSHWGLDQLQHPVGLHVTEETDAGEAFCTYIIMIDFVYNILYMRVCVYIYIWCMYVFGLNHIVYVYELTIHMSDRPRTTFGAFSINQFWNSQSWPRPRFSKLLEVHILFFSGKADLHLQDSTIYIADYQNHRVMKWKEGLSSAAPCGFGHSLDSRSQLQDTLIPF